jgi:ATP phosphoribosyltransferase
MRDIFARQMLQSTSSASTLVVLPGYSWLQDDVLNWLQPAIVAINQYACCKNTYFVEKKWKDEMDTCILRHEEIPKMHKIPRGTSKNAQHYMRNLQKCTKSHEEIPNMHKIPRGTSKNAQHYMRNLQKCTKSHEEILNMHKIPRESSENAQNLMINLE